MGVSYDSNCWAHPLIHQVWMNQRMYIFSKFGNH